MPCRRASQDGRRGSGEGRGQYSGAGAGHGDARPRHQGQRWDEGNGGTGPGVPRAERAEQEPTRQAGEPGDHRTDQDHTGPSGQRQVKHGQRGPCVAQVGGQGMECTGRREPGSAGAEHGDPHGNDHDRHGAGHRGQGRA